MFLYLMQTEINDNNVFKFGFANESTLEFFQKSGLMLRIIPNAESYSDNILTNLVNVFNNKFQHEDNYYFGSKNDICSEFDHFINVLTRTEIDDLKNRLSVIDNIIGKLLINTNKNSFDIKHLQNYTIDNNYVIECLIGKTNFNNPFYTPGSDWLKPAVLNNGNLGNVGNIEDKKDINAVK